MRSSDYREYTLKDFSVLMRSANVLGNDGRHFHRNDEEVRNNEEG